MKIMNKTIRKISAVVTAWVMLAGLAPVGVFAASTSVTPHAYTDSRVTNITSTSALVKGEAYTSPSGNAYEYGIAYSTSSSTSSATLQKVPNDRESFEITLTNLRPSTRYYYRTYITYYTHTSGSAQNTEYGAQYEFTTLSSSGSSSSSSSTSDPIINVPRISNLNATEAQAESSYVANGHTVSYAGFVYSSTNSTPTRNSNDIDLYDQMTEQNRSFSKRLTNLNRNTTYYVRAYITVINSNGTYSDIYSSVATFVSSGTSTPEVTTKSVNNINATGADVVIDVTSTGLGNIVERGVVYSTTASTPELYSGECKFEAVSGTTGEATVTLSNLETRKTYYVRAFVRNESTVYYGTTRSFVTENAVNVTTNDISGLTNSSVLASGTISDASSFAIVERGFVYSHNTSNPTINDSKVSAPAVSIGSYSLEITGLTNDTEYHIRAYVKTQDSYSYGNVVKFTTSAEEIKLGVTYRMLDNSVVSTETLSVAKDTVLTSTDLNLPSGYSLQMSNWSYTVLRPENISVTVVRGGDTSGAFMKGIGNYMFAPDRAATRAEVAEAIFGIAGRPSGYVGMTFSDVPANHPSKEAINYVSSMGYMRGYPEGTFLPSNSITRAEVCVILNMMYNPTGESTTTAFKDIEPTYFFYPYIAKAYNSQMIYGFEDGTFRPTETTTRAQICTMLINSEKRSTTPLGTAQFTDVPLSHWAYKYIMSAAVPES